MTNWNESELQRHLTDQIEESLHLDYKAAEALAKDDKKKLDISKDVSAMANADGGLIIYGMTEKHHLPREISWIDRGLLTREWLEEVIASRIEPRIPGLLIHGILAQANPTLGAYIVEIPRSHTAHQASDRRYYRRYNFESVPMRDPEVRHTMNRGIAEMIRRKISDGMGLLVGFFAMVAHAFCRDDSVRIMAVLNPPSDAGLQNEHVETVSELLANAMRDNAIFHPSRGTLREIPKEHGVFRVVVEAGEAPEPHQLPAGVILTQGVQMAVATCGTTLATFGPSMGLELVVEIDSLYERMCSADQVFSAICRNTEYLTRTEGRVDHQIFLMHVRTLVRDIARFRMHQDGRSARPDEGDAAIMVSVRV